MDPVGEVVHIATRQADNGPEKDNSVVVSRGNGKIKNLGLEVKKASN